MPNDNPARVVGLKYEPGEGLPAVVLKGQGPMADAILRERSRAGGPPLLKDRELLDRLYRLPIDAQIGPELFRIVAVVLAHVFAINSKLNQGGR